MIKKYWFLLIVFGAFLPSMNVRAEEAALIKQKTNEERCQEVWDPLWSEVRLGDVEARLRIVLAIVFGNLTDLPGHSDYLAKLRDIIILAVHSVGVTEANYKFVDIIYYENLENVSGSSKFFKCIEANRSQACAKILVDHHQIPAMQDYIDEINALIEAGEKPKCQFSRDLEIELSPSLKE